MNLSGPAIVVISGGSGASGRQVAETVLAQFPEARLPVLVVGHVRTRARLGDALELAASRGAAIVHTLVDRRLRRELMGMAAERGLPTFDLVGPLLEGLATFLGREPKGQPGLYRMLHREYFERVEAIEFAVAHDDGQRPQDLPRADIVLVGVSRCGKTPLAMYLAAHGWLVANVVFLAGRNLPPALGDVELGRVIALTLEPENLVNFRRRRQAALGVGASFPYAAGSEVYAELDEALKFYRRRGFTVVDVTDKPLETSADEIVELITSRFGPTRRASQGASP